MHGGGIERALAGKRHISDHVKGRAHHLVEHVDGPPLGLADTRGASVGGGAHDRGEVHHVAMRKHR